MILIDIVRRNKLLAHFRKIDKFKIKSLDIYPYQSQVGDRRPRHRCDPIENRTRIPIDDYDTLQRVPCSLIESRLSESYPRRARLK